MILKGDTYPLWAFLFIGNLAIGGVKNEECREKDRDEGTHKIHKVGSDETLQ